MSSTPQRNRTHSAKTPASERKRLDGLWEDNQWKCNCEPRRKAALRQVKKESKNKGRWFFTCASTPQCDFFLWQDLANIRQPGSGSPSTYNGTYNQSNTNPSTTTVQQNASQASPGSQTIQGSRPSYPSNPQYSQPRSAAATASSTQTLQPTTPSKRRRVVSDDDDSEFSDLGSDDERQLAAITDQSVSQATRKQDALATNPQQPQTPAHSTPKNSHSIVDAASGLPTPSVARTLFPTAGGNNNSSTTGAATSLADSPDTPSSTSTATLPATAAAAGEESTQTQVMQLLRRTTVSDDVLDQVQALLATAERKMEGFVRGRDAVRGALREKDVRIAELQERVTQLENRGFMQEGRIREMKAKQEL